MVNRRPAINAWLLGLSWLNLSALVATYPAVAVCRQNSVATDAAVADVTERAGYRLAAAWWDPVLRQGWTLVANCEHPEWPALALQTRASKLTTPSPPLTFQVNLTSTQAARPVVRAGDLVRLWRQEDYLRIEVAAMSEESAGLGKTVHVRLVRMNSSDEANEHQFVGIVRGPADVEMQR